MKPRSTSPPSSIPVSLTVLIGSSASGCQTSTSRLVGQTTHTNRTPALSQSCTFAARSDLPWLGEAISTADELYDFARVIAANWDPPDMGVLDVYRRCSRALLGTASPARLYLGYLDDEPVATSECFKANGVAGIYSVVTRPAVRRRGIGTACTSAALHDARSCSYTTAVLEASVFGLGMYTRLGFVACGDFHEYQ